MKRIDMAAMAIAIILGGTAAALSQSATAGATATMKDKDGKQVGTVTFNATPSGEVQVIVEMTGISAGGHGIHIHEKGVCDGADGFKGAGGHYAGGKSHGIMSDNGPHVGDLPNVTAGPDGVVKAEFFTDTISLDPAGHHPLKDGDGSAVVLHAKPDDYTSQPTGESGGRIACGVVE